MKTEKTALDSASGNIKTEGLTRESGLGDRLRRNLLWAGGGRFMSVVSLFLLHACLAHGLARDEYGAFLLMESAVLLLSVVILGGLPPVALRMLRWELIHRRADRAFSVVRATLFIMLVIGIGLAITTLVAVATGSQFVFFASSAKWLPWVLLWSASAATLRIVSELARGYELLGFSYFIGGQSGGFGVNLLLLTTVYTMLNLGTLSLAVAIPVLVGILAVCAIHSVLILLRLTSDGVRNGTDIHKPMPLKQILSGSMPLLIQQIVVYGIPEMDIILLGSMTTAEETAVYGVAKKLVVLSVVPLMLVNHSIQPFVAELFAQNRKHSLTALVRGSATLAAAPGLIYVAVLLIAPQTMISLTFGSGFEAASVPIRFLAVGSGVFLISGSCGLVQTMTGHERSAMWISVVAGTIYLSSAPSLIAHYSVAGAAGGAALLLLLSRVSSLLMVYNQERIWTGVTASRSLITEFVGLVRNRQSAPASSPLTSVSKR